MNSLHVPGKLTHPLGASVSSSIIYGMSRELDEITYTRAQHRAQTIINKVAMIVKY